MKVGLFFGSFNPIHIGHLVIAESVLHEADLDQVWFVVSPQNPFKKPGSLAPEQDRLHMVRLAIEDNYDMRAIDIEFRMPRPSYTVDTLTYLNEQYPSYEFKVIMGEDNLNHLHKWKNYEELLINNGFIVYPRPGQEATSDLKEHAHVQWVDAPLLDISATFIRKAIKKERSIRYLLPDLVCNYIQYKKLYAT
jgi:nicotinate-nucleotide adenylyltransferase